MTLRAISGRPSGSEETGAKFWSTLDPGQQAFTYQAGGLFLFLDAKPGTLPQTRLSCHEFGPVYPGPFIPFVYTHTPLLS